MFEYLTRRLDEQERVALRELIEQEKWKWWVYGNASAVVATVLIAIWRHS